MAQTKAEQTVAAAAADDATEAAVLAAAPKDAVVDTATASSPTGRKQIVMNRDGQEALVAPRSVALWESKGYKVGHVK